jgi:hypothetical protein
MMALGEGRYDVLKDRSRVWSDHFAAYEAPPGCKGSYPGLGRFRVFGSWYGGRAAAVAVTRLDRRNKVEDLRSIRHTYVDILPKLRIL